MASDIPDHRCPGCGVPQKAFLRNPWHFCNDCRKRATDGAGRVIEFANASLSGGLVWRYKGEDEWREAGNVACRIDRRPVIVREARFGGVVAEPIPSELSLDQFFQPTDLRRRKT